MGLTFSCLHDFQNRIMVRKAERITSGRYIFSESTKHWIEYSPAMGLGQLSTTFPKTNLSWKTRRIDISRKLLNQRRRALLLAQAASSMQQSIELGGELTATQPPTSGVNGRRCAQISTYDATRWHSGHR